MCAIHAVGLTNEHLYFAIGGRFKGHTLTTIAFKERMRTNEKRVEPFTIDVTACILYYILYVQGIAHEVMPFRD